MPKEIVIRQQRRCFSSYLVKSLQINMIRLLILFIKYLLAGLFDCICHKYYVHIINYEEAQKMQHFHK